MTDRIVPPTPPTGGRPLDWALWYSQVAGWSVFPVRGKTPLTAHGHLEASRDAERVAGWWRKWPDAGIGIPTGPVNRLAVVDVDPRNGGNDGFRTLVNTLGAELPPSAEVATGGGGRHHYFSTEARVRTRKGLFPGIDLCSAGAYVVAPPSLHATTAQPYRWERGPDALLPLPPGLAGLAGELNDPEDAAEGARAGAAAAGAVPYELIPEGSRNTVLTAQAGRLWRQGFSPRAILAALRALNAERCAVPLDDAEVIGIVQGIQRYAVPPTRGEHRTDLGNARRMLAQYGHLLRYCHPWGKWLVWDGRRWSPDQESEVTYLAGLTALSIREEARDCPDADEKEALAKWAAKSESSGSQAAMISLLRSQPGIPVIPEQLDADPWVLNFRNGTLDLQTGRLRPHSRDELLTKLVPHAYPAGDDPPPPTLWLQFLQRVLPSEELQRWSQVTMGYCLTGDTGQQRFWILYGGGANGKSTWINTLLGLLGTDYAQTAAPTLFRPRQSGQATNDIVDIKGARVVVEEEMPEHTHLNTDLLKKLTGGGILRARRLYAEWEDIQPQCKLLMASNTKPLLSEQTDAVWRRVRLVPFTVRIPDAEHIENYHELLLREAPLILRWAVDGLLAWRRAGGRLPDAESVRAATAGYRQESDLLGVFLQECCVLGRGKKVKWTALFNALRAWLMEQGVDPRRGSSWSRGVVLSSLDRRGHSVRTLEGYTWVTGLELDESRGRVLDLG